MKIYNTTIKSSDHKLDLHVLIYESENPKGNIVLTHGMCEHKERYIPFIEYLSNNNYNCIIYDHRGHGDSILNENDLGYFYDDTGNMIVEDLQEVILYTKSLFPTLPVYLFAHSMGTLVSQCYIQKYDAYLNGFITCGQPSKNPLSKAGLLLAKCINKIKGEYYRSKLLQSLSIGAYENKVKGTLEARWICTDEEVVKTYLNDPKCHYIFTTNGFINLMTLLNNAYKTNRNTPNNSNLPILFIAGSEDPCIVSLKEHQKAISYLQSSGYNNISNIIYPNVRHEILNEPIKQQVYDDVLMFLNKNGI